MEELQLKETTALGSLQVPLMGVGTWQWGDSIVWGYKKSSNSDIRAAFDACVENGLTFFDTAEMYGLGYSEKLLGEFIRDRDAIPVMVATKFMPVPWRWGRKDLVNALRKSLKRLQLVKVDLYQIHWPAPPIPIETWVEGLADVVDMGLASEVGVSNYNVDQTRRAVDVLGKRGLRLASNQVEYSLIERGPERSGLYAACQELGVKLIAYSPLGMGLLTGKYAPNNPPPGIRGRKYNAEFLQAIQPLITELRQMGEAHGGKTPAQVALNWCISKGTLPIPGAKNAKQVHDNAGALGWHLSAEEVQRLEEAYQP